MKLHEYFDKTYLINLDSRPDRLEESKAECTKYGITFERFRACNGQEEISILKPSATGNIDWGWGWNRGAAGMCLSLIKLLEKCQLDRVDSVLIMEDDVQFNPRLNNILDETMKQIPKSWESIFFGLWEFKSDQVSKNVFLIKEGLCLHCHALKKNVFQFIIDILSTLDDPADHKYNKYLFPRAKSFVIKPFLAWQRPSLSTIRGQYLDSKFSKAPELLTIEEIKELCTKYYILDDLLSKYKARIDSPFSVKLRPKKIRELCVLILKMELQLGRYEDYNGPTLDSLSSSKIQEICTRLFLLEGRLDGLPMRLARNPQNFIDYVHAVGSKRYNFAKTVYLRLIKYFGL
jgi:GR25 family glycosyltransferase involved in LPS biosynthesis